MKTHIVQEADEATDGRRTAPAALRNTGPLIEALRTRLPSQGRVLELASGTGQHVAAFASAFPNLDWTPSDVDAGQRESISAWRRISAAENITEPLAIDVAEPWPLERGFAQAVLTINLIHLISEASVSTLFEQARAVLQDGGRIFVYGPFLRGSEYASEGDRSFDESLRSRDSAIGFKSVEAVSEVATSNEFVPIATDRMPANNLLLTFAAAVP